MGSATGRANDGEVQAAIAVRDIPLDLLTSLLAYQRDALRAAGHRAVGGDHRIDPGPGVPAKLELMVIHVEPHQAGMRAGPVYRLKARAGAAILAVDRIRWLGSGCGSGRRRCSGASRKGST